MGKCATGSSLSTASRPARGARLDSTACPTACPTPAPPLIPPPDTPPDTPLIPPLLPLPDTPPAPPPAPPLIPLPDTPPDTPPAPPPAPPPASPPATVLPHHLRVSRRGDVCSQLMVLASLAQRFTSGLASEKSVSVASPMIGWRRRICACCRRCSSATRACATSITRRWRAKRAKTPCVSLR